MRKDVVGSAYGRRQASTVLCRRQGSPKDCPVMALWWTYILQVSRMLSAAHEDGDSDAQ